MAYSFDQKDAALVISGFEKGIAVSPYAGISNMQSVNPSSIQGEVSVSFSTQSVTQAPVLTNNTQGTLSSYDDGLLIPSSLKLEWNQYVIFSGLGGATGLSINTPYQLAANNAIGANSLFNLYTVAGVAVTISASSTSTVTFSTISPTTPKFFEQSASTYFMIDDSGRVWSNYITTKGGGGGSGVPATDSWTWTGNTTDSTSHGNGMVYWRTAHDNTVGDWDGWLFIFRDGQIDYSNVNGVTAGVAYNNIGTWSYNWQPTGTYLTGMNLSECPHNAIVGPDGNIYFCDYFTLWKIEQFDVVTPTTFSPSNSATYIAVHAHNLPIYEIATCIAPLGTNFIVGGVGNQAYIWDGVTELAITNPILLAESYIKQIVTVNVNAYIFCGNRGNIYVTNGSQATPFAKIPDHISNTVEPYFAWGDATYNRDRLYFSALAMTNASANITGYGGVWAIDLVTNSMWLSNQLSYGAYTGYASALWSLPSLFENSSLPTEPAGYGLLIGWNNSTTYGVDQTISAPYTSGAAIIESDLIPIGTFNVPQNNTYVEYKLSTPLVAGESITINSRTVFGSTWSLIGTDSTVGHLSNTYPSNWANAQWVQFQAVLTSTGTTPSYVRLQQLRVAGFTGPSFGQQQILTT